MDKRDVALLSSCSTLPVPRFSKLDAMDEAGERLLVASNGIFLEILRKWGHFIRRVGDFTQQITVPYGNLQEVTSLFLPFPRDEIAAFDALARDNCHTEIAASIFWNEKTGTFRMVPAQTINASGSHIRYERSLALDGEHLVFDCHSHGRYSAFFSKTDNLDDRSEVKIAYVVGNCDQPQQTRQYRLCLRGIFNPIKEKA